MKKLLLLAGATAMFFCTTAQDKKSDTKVVKDETTVKRTSTVPQKVHNTFSKHKHYNGKKMKHTKEVETKTTK